MAFLSFKQNCQNLATYLTIPDTPQHNNRWQVVVAHQYSMAFFSSYSGLHWVPEESLWETIAIRITPKLHV